MESARPRNSRSRVVIDARMIEPQGHGIAMYVQNIARGLALLRDSGEGLPYDPVFLLNPRMRGLSAVSGFQVEETAVPWLNPREWFEIPRLLAELRADLFHSPSFCAWPVRFPLGILTGPPCPWIVTIHDLIHLSYGSRMRKLYYRHLLRPFARKSAAVVTVSEHSRHELSEWLEMEPRRIDLVMNAIDANFGFQPTEEECRAVLHSRGLDPGRYFFALSNPKPHKNLRMLIEAYRSYRECAPDPWPLVLSVPRDSFPDAGRGVIQTGALGDLEAQALLRKAGVFTFPSLSEGFGRPPLEAVVAGVALIVSDIPPHREGLRDVKDDEVLFVSPLNVSDWTEALLRAASGGLRSASPETRGEILKRFQAASAGKDMDRIYRRVLKV